MTSLHKSKLQERNNLALSRQALRTNKTQENLLLNNTEQVEYLYAYDNYSITPDDNKTKTSKKRSKKSKSKLKNVSDLVNISDEEETQTPTGPKKLEINFSQIHSPQESESETPRNQPSLLQNNDSLFNYSSDTISNSSSFNKSMFEYSESLNDDISINDEYAIRPQTALSNVSRPQTALNDLPKNSTESSKFAFIPGMENVSSIEEFILKPASFEFSDQSIKARITRDKKSKKFGGPCYYMHLEIPESGSKCFVLCGRKRSKGKRADYLISTNLDLTTNKHSDSVIGRLKSNVMGTRFMSHLNGSRPNDHQSMKNTDLLRKEMVMIMYETNILGFHGPRKMTVVIPGMDSSRSRVESQPLTESESIPARFDRNDIENLVSLENKKPIWNDDTQSFVLNFHGRVTQASVKNFQIIHKKDPSYIIMQFGRISEDVFTIDYKYPMCAYQAFAVALSSFDSKLACE